MSPSNTQSTFSPQRSPGREHIPLFPRGFIAIRLVQSLLALVAVGLTGYGVSFYGFSSNEFVLVMGILTLLSNTYVCVSDLFLPVAYNYWAVLSFEIFFTLMWLIAFAVLAAVMAAFYSADLLIYSDVQLRAVQVYVDTQLVAAAFGGFEFILYVISLVFTSVMIHRHRSNGLHNVSCHPGARPGVQAAVEIAGEKHELQPQVPRPTAQPVASV